MKKLVLLSALLFCMTIGFAQKSSNEEHIVKEYATVIQNGKKKQIEIIYSDNQEIIKNINNERYANESQFMTILNKLSKEGWDIIG